MWKEVNTRSEADMMGEVVRQLTSLPKYTAYARVLQGQKVWKGEIKTLALKEELDVEQIEITRKYVRTRTAIADEIRQRQEAWRSVAREVAAAEKGVEVQPGLSPSGVCYAA